MNRQEADAALIAAFQNRRDKFRAATARHKAKTNEARNALDNEILDICEEYEKECDRIEKELNNGRNRS